MRQSKIVAVDVTETQWKIKGNEELNGKYIHLGPDSKRLLNLIKLSNRRDI